MLAMIVDEELREVPHAIAGELLLSGPQVTPGYWNDPSATAKAYVVPPGQKATYYRTGDRVLRRGPDKPLLYLGRVDNQVKILGHRVELAEVEAAVRKKSGIHAVVAVGWPITTSGAGGIEAFLEAEDYDIAALLKSLSNVLPTYMTPRRIHLLPDFPINANGKFDRKAMLQILETKL